MRRSLLMAVVLATLGLTTPAHSQQSNPFQQDPMGPLIDVSDRWKRFQPARAFCIRPEVFEVTGQTGATATGRDPACRRSGFPRRATGLYRVTVGAPPLCPGCRRLFIDYSRIPERNAPPLFYARGHVYFRLQSWNGGYTVDPRAHSPNIKNFTNDKLFVPDGSPQERIVHAFDLHSMAYTGDTANFAHAAPQGPWYAGPWYLNRAGKRIVGAFLDVQVGSAQPTGRAELDEIAYMSGFNSGEPTCPDNFLLDGEYADGNYLYASCADHFGGSSQGVNPFA